MAFFVGIDVVKATILGGSRLNGCSAAPQKISRSTQIDLTQAPSPESSPSCFASCRDSKNWLVTSMFRCEAQQVAFCLEQHKTPADKCSTVSL